MTTCPYCESPISDDNPALLIAALEDGVPWDSFESDHRSWAPVGKKWEVDGVGEIEVVAKKTDLGYDSYGTRIEGEVFVVLKVGDRYFKKSGTGDSYGDLTWTGPLRPVQPREVTKVVYEF